MNPNIRSAILCIIFTAIAVPSLADDSQIRKSLTANYAAISAAFKKQSTKTMADFMTKDFTALQPGGNVKNKEQVLADIERQVQAMKNPLWVRTIGTITQKGGDAIVNVRGKITGTVADPEGKPHQMEFNAKAKDTWTKSGNGW